MARALLKPQINQAGLPGYLLWARRDNPALYAGLRKQFPEVAQFESALQGQGVSGVADMFKSAAASLKPVAKNIGSFVSKYALPLAAVAVPLVIAKRQADVAKAQFQLADAQQRPMLTAVDPATGVAVPVQQAGGQWQAVPVQGGMIGASVATGAAPSQPLPKWIWIAAAAAGVLALPLLLRKR